MRLATTGTSFPACILVGIRGTGRRIAVAMQQSSQYIVHSRGKFHLVVRSGYGGNALLENRATYSCHHCGDRPPGSACARPSQPCAGQCSDASAAQGILAQQGIATITTAERPDGIFLRKCTNVLVNFVACHGTSVSVRVPAACRQKCRQGTKFPSLQAHRQPGDHACHDAHAHHDVGGIRYLHAGQCKWRSDRAHGKRHDIHRSTAHAAIEQRQQSALHSRGSSQCW